jgi:hypothetical protein
MRNFAAGILLLVCFCNNGVWAQSFNDVVISEIMSDPSPPVGLPEVEYLELYNRTGSVISLKGWKLTMGSRTVPLPDSVIFPGAFSLLCHRNSAASLQIFGKVVGLSSFQLTNEGAVLALYNQKNQLVYSVSYTANWWLPEKRSGGYALELIDNQNPCGEKSNWAVSKDNRGGTPGAWNSVEGNNADITPPLIERADVPGANEIVLIFNERLDSTSAALSASIEIPGRKVLRRKLDLPAFHNLSLILDAPLLPGRQYEVRISNVSDCSGNILREAVVYVGIPLEADSGDVVINEILFNPRPDGVDFVEIYNRSTKYISLKGWNIGNLKNDKSDVLRVITNDIVSISPGNFLVLSIDPEVVKEQYPADVQRNFLSVSAMPAFPNEQGGVILQNANGLAMDRFLYSESMHHPLVHNPEGVSLEKIDPGKPSGEPGNWHSAAGVVGYATPGYANSQALNLLMPDDFVIEPEGLTPDKDGVDDVAEIKFTQNSAGRFATIRVFDTNGHLVKNLIQNQLLGTRGAIVWDGTDERSEVVKTGYYLILIETFDISGNKNQFRKKVVVASRK